MFVIIVNSSNFVFAECIDFEKAATKRTIEVSLNDKKMKSECYILGKFCFIDIIDYLNFITGECTKKIISI